MKQVWIMIFNHLTEGPPMSWCMSRIVGSVLALTHTITSLFSVQDLWFLAPLSWLIVAYVAIRFTPPRVVERIKVVKAGRSQLRMTDFMRPKWRQGRIHDYYKSAKKRAKKRRRFIECNELPVRNVRSRLLEKLPESVNCVPLNRKDKCCKHHLHQKSGTNTPHLGLSVVRKCSINSMV